MQLFIFSADDDDLQIERGFIDGFDVFFNVAEPHAAAHDEHSRAGFVQTELAPHGLLILLLSKLFMNRDTKRQDTGKINAAACELRLEIFTRRNNIFKVLNVTPVILYGEIRDDAKARAGDRAALFEQVDNLCGKYHGADNTVGRIVMDGMAQFRCHKFVGEPGGRVFIEFTFALYVDDAGRHAMKFG